jgi:hypothetical protein
MEKRNDLLIYGVEYDLYRDGEHIGSAVWTDDENVGEAFLQEQDNGSFLVFTNIDEWEIKNK